MENITFIQAYAITFGYCILITVAIILLLQKGLKNYLEKTFQDKEISSFFQKLINLVVILGSTGAALRNDYMTSDANWLTLTWDIAKQLEQSLERVFITLMVLVVTLLFCQILLKKSNHG